MSEAKEYAEQTKLILQLFRQVAESNHKILMDFITELDARIDVIIDKHDA